MIEGINMTYNSYTIRIESGGDFDAQFKPYIRANPNAGAYLLTQIERFATDTSAGSWVRGNPPFELHVVASRTAINGDGSVGILVEVNRDAYEVMPIRLVNHGRKETWDEIEKFADHYLKI